MGKSFGALSVILLVGIVQTLPLNGWYSANSYQNSTGGNYNPATGVPSGIQGSTAYWNQTRNNGGLNSFGQTGSNINIPSKPDFTYSFGYNSSQEGWPASSQGNRGITLPSGGTSTGFNYNHPGGYNPGQGSNSYNNTNRGWHASSQWNPNTSTFHSGVGSPSTVTGAYNTTNRGWTTSTQGNKGVTLPSGGTFSGSNYNQPGGYNPSQGHSNSNQGWHTSSQWNPNTSPVAGAFNTTNRGWHTSSSSQWNRNSTTFPGGHSGTGGLYNNGGLLSGNRNAWNQTSGGNGYNVNQNGLTGASVISGHTPSGWLQPGNHPGNNYRPANTFGGNSDWSRNHTNILIPSGNIGAYNIPGTQPGLANSSYINHPGGFHSFGNGQNAWSSGNRTNAFGGYNGGKGAIGSHYPGYNSTYPIIY